MESLEKMISRKTDLLGNVEEASKKKTSSEKVWRKSGLLQYKKTIERIAQNIFFCFLGNGFLKLKLVLETSHNETFLRKYQMLREKKTIPNSSPHHLKTLGDNVIVSSDMVSAFEAAVNPSPRGVPH